MYLTPFELEILKIVGEWMVVLGLISFFNIFLVIRYSSRDGVSKVFSGSIGIIKVGVAILFLVSIFVMSFVIYLASTISDGFLHAIIILVDILLVIIQFLFIYSLYAKG